MGSFSVSCGMSKLPITSNEKIVFIPLKQNVDHRGNPNSLSTNHIIYGENEFFKPFFLPIEGEYDTYGSLDDIVENENVKVLEKHYNKSILEIIETITNGRSIFDSFSGMNKIWGLTSFEKNNIKAFEGLGFKVIKNDNEEYMYNEDYNLKITSKDKSKFEISSDYKLSYSKDYQRLDFDTLEFIDETKHFEKDIKIIEQISGNSLQVQIYNETNIILGLKNKEDMEKLQELSKLSGMFILKEVYEKMSHNLNFNTFNNNNIIDENASINKQTIRPIHLHLLGFENIDGDNFKFKDIDIKLKYDAEVTINGKSYDDGRYITNINDLVKFLNSKTNNNFDINLIKDVVGSKSELLNLRYEIDYNINVLKVPKNKIEHILNIMFRDFDDKTNIFKTNELYKNILLDYLTYNDLDNNFVNNLCIEIDKFNTFKSAMVATNTPFMSSYSGYQDGCVEMNKYLNEITSSIIEDRFKEYERDM